ncbi:enoyl-CoA hydratase/isomerase family protein [Spelaeicoccus albus]|uniref:3-hydroxyisobutyryl-CoA hydrolase n=1 Tax=Spelaeicoccus albus TaxID=1280376 RepID=A0A7Z0D5G1_9MICO|nr:enoyl-CoA hydratase/isomerase family protein [Spelaeicoccus albus]NYI69242.1 enoyl-CoA hydratase [Spelaeicoccus albus]
MTSSTGAAESPSADHHREHGTAAREPGRRAGDELLHGVTGGLARLTLNRPRAINALTEPMIMDIASALDDWATDDDVHAVLIDGAGERGLCAGGDIRAIYEDVKAAGSASIGFWRHEYRMNVRIAEFPKPYIALMDGITMGGGVGVSAHGSVRVVTERSKIGMPETGIGFAPDVGGTYLLARTPGEIGTHLALTAGVMGPGDAIACGFADHFIHSDDVPAFIDAVAADPARAVAVAAEMATDPPAAALAGDREWIDECYSASSVEDILRRLDAHSHPDAADAASAIRAKSPTSVKVTFAELRAARGRSLRAAIEQEFRVSSALTGRPDLVEGIRAQVVDKDRNPRWSPAALDDVSADQVASILDTHVKESVLS